MNTTYTVYDPNTGRFTGQTLSLPPELVEQNTPESMMLLEGEFDSRTQRLNLETMEVVECEDTGLTERQARIVRQRRDSLLTACDWRVTRAQEDGVPLPEGWREYRTALRNLTDQEGFPASVVWPVPPHS